ncbi:innate immunity activator protein [Macrosteles quadrilineatus]|uniref:innate immunity activator protein n=1 Tax=Macrosteles quadrilineatus TaxID=74068 RepID=UPI0023E32271|nr:innate immunity activator protein [Macrosteles quadrilineatus]
MEYESPQTKVDMVASLQSRKDSLEAKIKEKNEELKALCIQEAELTGVLPLETPLEAGESPPVFRRRVGTSFTYPENLINKLKSKEEESLATLELEYNIQTGIAEAARSLANDGTVSKAARRKHRIVYQQSQRRLLELESQLRQASRCPLKQRKKPRPPLESDQVDGGGGGGLVGDNVNGVSLSPVQDKLYHQNHQVVTHVGSSRYNSVREPTSGMPYRNTHRQIQSEVAYQQSWGYQPSSQPREFERTHRVPHDLQGNRYKENNNWYNTAPTSRYLGVGSKPEDDEEKKSVRYRDRFGSLDRRRGSGETFESELRQSVLLPNQTYPETSHHLTQGSRKTKKKDWFETSLDTSHPVHSTPTPPPPPHTPTPTPTPPIPHYHPPPHPHPHTHTHTHTQAHSHTSGSEGDPAEQIHMPVSQQLSFDTVVPFESPKNHTVVQAGMWQPYREVTKPFEMADFYKYSTKFRKNASSTPPVSQQKAVYRPLQPMTCEPLAVQESGTDKVGCRPDSDDPYSHEMLSWYQDQTTPQARSATLV